MTNSKYIFMTFLLYIGSAILYGVVAALLIGPEGFTIFSTIGLGIALFSWCLFFVTKILPTTMGKNGLPFCVLLFTSFVFLLPAAIISYIIIDNNVSDTSHPNPHRFSSSSKKVWENKPSSISNSTANSDQLIEADTTQTNNLPDFNIQNSINNTNLDKREMTATFDFGFKLISNEEIQAQFNEIRLHVKLKNEIHNQLAKWIDEQAQQRGVFIPYPDIYLKSEKYIELNM